MDEKIRDALGSLHLPQASADQAWEGISRRMNPPRRRPVRMALCGVLVFLMAAGGWTYFTPTAYLSVESGSACELQVNCFGRVVGVQAHSPQGEALAEELAVPFVGYEEAVEELLSQKEGGASITVTGSSQSQCQKILRQMEEDTALLEDVACEGASLEERQLAQEAGLPMGKYRIYARIAERDPGFTPEEAAALSMNQLRRRLEDLSQDGSPSEDSSSQAEETVSSSREHPGKGPGQGLGSGQGYGQGHGKQWGRE